MYMISNQGRAPSGRSGRVKSLLTHLTPRENPHCYYIFTHKMKYAVTSVSFRKKKMTGNFFLISLTPNCLRPLLGTCIVVIPYLQFQNFGCRQKVGVTSLIFGILFSFGSTIMR